MKTKLFLIVSLFCGAFLLVSFQSGNTAITEDPVTITKSKVTDDVDRFFNYPDPFVSKTIIYYTLEQETPVFLYVVGPDKMNFILLVNEVQKPGVHKVEFFPYLLKQGTYMAIMKINNGIQMETMTKVNTIIGIGPIGEE